MFGVVVEVLLTDAVESLRGVVAVLGVFACGAGVVLGGLIAPRRDILAGVAGAGSTCESRWVGWRREAARRTLPPLATAPPKF